MKNENAEKVLALILSLVLISASFFVGYYAVQSVFEVPKEIRSFLDDNTVAGNYAGVKKENRELIWPSAPGTIHCELIRVVGEQPKLIVSALSSAEGKWRILTVPEDTRIYLTGEQYKKYTVTYPALPQMFQIAVLRSYMSAEEEAVLLGEILESVLYCRFAHIRVVDETDLSAWISGENDAMKAGEVTETFLNASVGSNDSVTERLKRWQSDYGYEDPDIFYYSEVIGSMKTSDVIGQILPGERENDGYRIDLNQARILLN